MVPVWLASTGVIATTTGVLLALYIAVWREPRKAARERADSANKATEERTRYEAQMAALQRAETDRVAAQARRVVPEVSKSVILEGDIWIAHIKNASNGAIGQLKVAVVAHDADGNVVEDAIAIMTGQLDLSGAFRKMISDVVGGGASGVASAFNPYQQLQGFGGYGSVQPGMEQLLKQSMAQQLAPVSQYFRQALVSQLQKAWPSQLGPGGETSVAYKATKNDLTLRIAIGFEDEAGYLWTRIGTDQPERVTPEQFGLTLPS